MLEQLYRGPQCRNVTLVIITAVLVVFCIAFYFPGKLPVCECKCTLCPPTVPPPTCPEETKVHPVQMPKEARKEDKVNIINECSSEPLLNWILKNRPRRDFSDSNNKTGYTDFIVPNIVHFIRFEEPEMSFIDMLTIKAVFQNHGPDKIYIHCDPCNFKGKYWDMVREIPILDVRHMPRPTHIYGKKFSQVWHAADIARLIVLMTYGGIFLDNDCYVVQSLNKFRRFEFAIGWYDNEFLGTQVLVAHKDARFLLLWYETYKHYRPDLWYFNAGELPTTSVLNRNPALVHRVKVGFGVTNLMGMLYGQYTKKWHDFHVIHLLIRHRKKEIIAEFNEENVKWYNRTFGEMARDVLYKNKMINNTFAHL